MAENPFELEKFLAFVESKPGEETFDFSWHDKGAVNAFVVAHGGRYIPETAEFELRGQRYSADGCPETQAVDDMCWDMSDGHDYTFSFGALAERIRAALKAREASRG